MKKIEKKPHLNNPPLVFFGPIDDEAIEHYLTAGNQDGRCASKVAARSTTIFEIKVDGIT